MTNRLYVGNLSFETTENDVVGAFSEIGPVTEAQLIMDRASGRSRGFAFVSMSTSEHAQKAMVEMNGRNLHGRDLRVTEAQERQTDGRPFGGRSRR